MLPVAGPPSKDTDLFGNEITVRHTFPYNPDSKTAPETAKRWANNDTWDYKTRTHVKGPEPEFLERANARLTEDTVQTIKRRLMNGARVCDVAEEFRVSRSQVNRIRCNKQWQHVKVEE